MNTSFGLMKMELPLVGITLGTLINIIFILMIIIAIYMYKIPIMCYGCEKPDGISAHIFRCVNDTSRDSNICKISTNINTFLEKGMSEFQLISNVVLSTLSSEIPDEIKNGLTNLLNEINNLYNNILNKINSLNIGEFIYNKFNEVKDKVMNSVNEFNEKIIQPIVKYIIDLIISPILELIDKLQEFKMVIQKSITTSVENLTGVVLQLNDGVMKIVNEIPSDIINKLKALNFTNVYDKMKFIPDNVLKEIILLGENVNNTVVIPVSNNIIKVKDGINITIDNVTTPITNVKNDINNKIQNIKDSLGQVKININKSIDETNTIIKTVATPFVDGTNGIIKAVNTTVGLAKTTAAGFKSAFEPANAQFNDCPINSTENVFKDCVGNKVDRVKDSKGTNATYGFDIFQHGWKGCDNDRHEEAAMCFTNCPEGYEGRGHLGCFPKNSDPFGVVKRSWDRGFYCPTDKPKLIGLLCYGSVSNAEGGDLKEISKAAIEKAIPQLENWKIEAIPLPDLSLITKPLTDGFNVVTQGVTDITNSISSTREQIIKPIKDIYSQIEQSKDYLQNNIQKTSIDIYTHTKDDIEKNVADVYNMVKPPFDDIYNTPKKIYGIVIDPIENLKIEIHKAYNSAIEPINSIITTLVTLGGTLQISITEFFTTFFSEQFNRIIEELNKNKDLLISEVMTNLDEIIASTTNLILALYNDISTSIMGILEIIKNLFLILLDEMNVLFKTVVNALFKVGDFVLTNTFYVSYYMFANFIDKIIPVKTTKTVKTNAIFGLLVLGILVYFGNWIYMIWDYIYYILSFALLLFILGITSTTNVPNTPIEITEEIAKDETIENFSTVSFQAYNDL